MNNLKAWFLDAVPVKRKTPADWILPAMLGFGVGLAAGVGIGMLYAPEAGEDARLRLREKASRVKDRAAESAGRARSQIANAAEPQRERSRELG